MNPKSDILSDIGSGYHIKPNDKVVFITKESNQDIMNTLTSPPNNQVNGKLVGESRGGGDRDGVNQDLMKINKETNK